MSRLYDDDIYAWSQQQADVLRRMAEVPGRYPNELDIENVAEEIQDLGASQRDMAESFIRLILVHLIKLAASPNSESVRHWRSEIVNFHAELMSKLTPAMHGRIDLDRPWRRAKRQARESLEETECGESLVWNRDGCPLDLAAFSHEDFDIDRALGELAGES